MLALVWLIMSTIMTNKIDKVNHGVSAVPEELLEALHAVVHAARASQRNALRDSGVALTPLEARILGFFARRPGATQSALAEHSGRDKGQVARLVSGLRDRGLLEAVADDADKRITRIHLSEQAMGLHRTLLRQRQQLARLALEDFDTDERATLLALLHRLRQNIERNPASGQAGEPPR